MRPRNPGRSSIVEAAAGGFLAGAVTVVVVVWGYPHVVRSPISNEPQPIDRSRATASKTLPLVSDDGGQGVFETLKSPPPVAKPPIPPSATPPAIEADPLSELRDRHLELPVRGVVRGDLRDSFLDTRGSSHNHEAIDIMTPRNTPILAVEDGTIARLFESKAGGTTVYQVDPTDRYVYYYAHLERYADGLQEGQHVQRGQVLGYAGTSGNAPKDTPHLHFAIFRLTEKKQWWQGSPIDPYDVLK